MHIPVTDAALPFTPKCLGPDSKVQFLVKPLTDAEFDRLGFELFRHNIAPISSDTYRAMMIEEVFRLYGDEKGEEGANLLDEYWQEQDLYSTQVNDWHQRERDRQFDERNGAPRRPVEPMPERTMSIRRRSQALLFAEKLKADSFPIRDLTIEMQNYEAKQRDGITRLVLEGWDGVKTPFKKEHGIVDESLFEAVRSEIGKEAIAELHVFVASLSKLDEEERGNSDLPLDIGSDQSGLPIPSDELEISAGNSTDAPSGPIPVDVSGEIIPGSLISISAATGESSNIDDSPMAEESSSNQSG